MTSMGEEPVSEQEFQAFAKVVILSSFFTTDLSLNKIQLTNTEPYIFNRFCSPMMKASWTTKVRNRKPLIPEIF